MSGGRSIGAQRQMQAIAQSQPETGPWLALIDAAITEAENPIWDEIATGITPPPDQPALAPILSEATLPIASERAANWVQRFLTLASQAGPEGEPLGEADRIAQLDVHDYLEAAINQDSSRLSGLAISLGVSADTLGALGQLLVMPLLHAARRRFLSVAPTDRGAGYCPICGAWPALAETRGLERARRLRCSRCGGDWGMAAFRCPYCANDDHRTQGSLFAEGESETRRAETCNACHGYLKSIATLRPYASDEVTLADLASIDLDLAAIERGFARPEAPALALAVTLRDETVTASPPA